MLVGGPAPSGVGIETYLFVPASLRNIRPRHCPRLHLVREVRAAVMLFLRRYVLGQTSGARLQVRVMTRGSRTTVSYIVEVAADQL